MSAQASSSKRKRTDEGASASSKKKSKDKKLAKLPAAQGDFLAEGASVPSGKAVARVTDKQGKIGAVFASFADIEPPHDTPFTLYAHKDAKAEAGEAATLNDSLILAGETDAIAYVGNNWMNPGAAPSRKPQERREARDYNGEYMVGIYDPATSTVELRAAPAFIVRRSIKALNDVSASISGYGVNDGNMTWDSRVAARRDLGEAFGNRKTKLKAKADDRMKVNTANMAGIMETVQKGIAENSHDAQDPAAIKAAADLLRPIPPPNFDAKEPSEAYPISVLVSDALLRALDVGPLMRAKEERELRRLFPSPGPASSDWLVHHTWEAIQRAKHGSSAAASGADGILKANTGSKEDGRLRVRICMYVATLWAFRRNSGMIAKNREGLSEKLKLKGVAGGDAVVEDLLARFAEKQRGVSKYQVTGFTETKLLAYMFALALHLDYFTIDAASLANDLGLPPTKVNEIFKSIGCSSQQIASLKSDGTTKKDRRLQLKMPLTLPKASRGGPVKR